MRRFKYRLERLLETRVEAREEAERSLAEQKRALAAAEEKLAGLRDEQEAAAGRLAAAAAELKTSGPASGLSYQRQVAHVEGLRADLEGCRDRVFGQEMVVAECREKLAAATRELTERWRDVEVLEKHKEKKRDEFRNEERRREEAEQDEMASLLSQARKDRRP